MKEAVDGCQTPLCSDQQLNMDKLVAFGSDCAALRMGNRNGVAAKLMQAVPWIIATHCVAHSLYWQLMKFCIYIKRFKSILGQLY